MNVSTPKSSLTIQSSMLVSIGRFEFNRNSLELFENGKPVALALRPAQLFDALIEAAPGILSRQKACELLWPNGANADPEAGLNACVRQLRSALGENAEQGGMIVTLPKRGYRLSNVEIKMQKEKCRAAESAHDAEFGFQSNLILQSRRRQVFVPMFVGIILFGLIFTPMLLDRSFVETDSKTSELLLRGRSLLDRPYLQSKIQALEYFEKAVLLTPSSADAHGWRALALQRVAGTKNYPYQTAYPALLAAAEASDALGKSAPAAEAKGYYYLFAMMDLKAARLSFKQAIKRDPDQSSAYTGLASVEAAAGNTSAAFAAAQQARQIDPDRFTTRSDLCWFATVDRRGKQAVEICRWAIELDGSRPYFELAIALSTADAKERKEAFGAYLSMRGITGVEPFDLNDQFTCDPAQKAEALDLPKFEVSSLYALCGDAKSSGHWLESSKRESDRSFMFVPIDPRYDSVRNALTLIN